MQKDCNEKLMTAATEIEKNLIIQKLTFVHCGGERIHTSCMQKKKNKSRLSS